ncbi:MAG: hemerythrin domain-containing protein [Actinomycetota bacterium]|nr:hemerythrin domain-containing protein [Actinomycetota bacterium]
MARGPSDALVIRRNDHKEVRALFTEFQKAGTTDRRKGTIVEKVIELLTVHTFIENEVMYPQVRQLLPELEQDVLESYEEHHVADVLVVVLIENVTHHMDEEEQDWFPKVRADLGRTQLQDLGQQLLDAKKTAPRSPAQPSALKKTVDAILA